MIRLLVLVLPLIGATLGILAVADSALRRVDIVCQEGCQ